MRVCSDLLYDFFTLQRDYNKKEGTPSWQEPVPSFQNTSQRKYPNVMIRIFNLFCKLKNIKISDQEWFDRAIAKFNLLEQVCPYCDSKEQMIFQLVLAATMAAAKQSRTNTLPKYVDTDKSFKENFAAFNRNLSENAYLYQK